MALEVDVFGTTTIAMCVFFIGYAIVMRLKVLRDYSIPESVVGGFACAVLIALIYYLADVEITFDLVRRDILLVYFFAALGLRSSLAELIFNGRPLIILVALASVFIVVQNVAGIAIARAFNYDPNLGIVAGSMALTGRSGTTIAWAPFLKNGSAFNTFRDLAWASIWRDSSPPVASAARSPSFSSIAIAFEHPGRALTSTSASPETPKRQSSITTHFYLRSCASILRSSSVRSSEWVSKQSACTCRSTSHAWPPESLSATSCLASRRSSIGRAAISASPSLPMSVSACSTR